MLTRKHLHRMNAEGAKAEAEATNVETRKAFILIQYDRNLGRMLIKSRSCCSRSIPTSLI